MALTIQSSAIRIERPTRSARGLTVASIGSLGAAAGLLAIGAGTGLAWAGTLGAFGLLGGFTLAVAAVLNRFFMRPSTRPVGDAQAGSVVLDGDGVVVTLPDQDEHRFDGDAVRLGWTDAEGAVVIELHTGERLVLGGLAAEKRHSLLHALGTASSERVMDTTIAGPYQSSQGCLRSLAAALIPIVSLGVLTAPCALVPVVVKSAQSLMAGALATGALTLGVTAIVMGLLATAAFGMVRFYRPRRVRVGTDGVRISGTLGSQLIRYGEISEVGSEGGAVVLGSKTGPDRVLVGGEPALAIRIREAMEAQRERRSSGVRVELLDQGERAPEAWRSDLAKLAQSATRYRDRGLNTQELAEVVEDPACSPRRRVAAAFALSQGDPDAPARRRVRVAAEACADDQLRLALEEAAQGELSDRRLRRCCYDPQT
ncbi:MAG: hypothetical protein JRI68_04655 [Deltaproteobacteria bacterium]|nr:hypothetical protein [Deltaproteobacteria bacterium]